MTDEKEERELVRSVKESDLDAFGILFERYQPFLFRSVLFQVRDADEAHDIVQESFVRVWEHRSSLKPGLSFAAFLHRISTNLIKDRYRHKETRIRSKNLIPPPIPPPNADPIEAAEHSILLEEIQRIVREELPDRCRTVFELSRFEGLGTREIAQRLGTSVKTVENQLTKSLRIVQTNLKAFRNR